VHPQLWWFVARASGLVAFALLGVAVIGGLLLSTQLVGRRPAAPWLLDWHRFVGGLSVVFTLIHLVALWADDYIEFSVVELLVPFASQWRPSAVAWGVIAWWMLLAVELTSLVRSRLSRRWWHRVHLLSIPLFALACVHTFTAGTDARHPVVLLVLGGLAATVVLLLALRRWSPAARPDTTG
jgi:predicted ferric reductase